MLSGMLVKQLISNSPLEFITITLSLFVEIVTWLPQGDREFKKKKILIKLEI